MTWREFCTGQPYTKSVQGDRGRWHTEKHITVPPLWFVLMGFGVGLVVAAVVAIH